MKLKKVIAIVVVVAVLTGAAVGGVYGYKSYQNKNLVAEVQTVASLNMGYWGDTETSYGVVTNDSSQEVYLEDSGKVEQIFVEAGQTVKEGDPLVQYDISEVEMELKRKRLEMSTLNNSIAIANHELEKLKKTTPVDKKRPKVDLSKFGVESTEELESEYTEENAILSLPEKDETDDRIYNYVTDESVPYNADTADGSSENPYIYYCNKGVYAYGSFYNSIRPTDDSEGKHVLFIICKKDSDGKMVLEELRDEIDNDGTEILEKPIKLPVVMTPVPDESVENNYIEIDGNSLPTDYDEDRMWYVFSGEEVGDALQDLIDSITDAEDWKEPEGYTKDELAEAITKKEDELKKLDIDRRKGELELQSLEESASDGIVYAKLDGVVKSVADVDKLGSNTDTPLVVINGDEGLYVSGTVSELQLDAVKPGTIVTANSWESGMTFEATVTEVSDYPVSGNSWGDGNPNVSYYKYTAYIDDSSALKNGESVDLSIQSNDTENGSGIYIEKAYVRQEDGRSYVMMADENDCLKKQYVTTGKTVYGTSIEIKSGLTESDRIAFPYGKEAVEGTKVTDAEDTYYY